VDGQRVSCRVGDKSVRPDWVGQYLRFEHVNPGQVATIEFPVETRTETWAAPPQETTYQMSLPRPGLRLTLKFRGNTLVELSPPLGPGSWLYQSRPEKYKPTQAPLTKVTRYVTPTVLKW
jgi:hypothetical protein